MEFEFEGNHLTLRKFFDLGSETPQQEKFQFVHMDIFVVAMHYPSKRDFCLNFRAGTIYPTPPLGQDMTQGQFLSGV